MEADEDRAGDGVVAAGGGATAGGGGGAVAAACGGRGGGSPPERVRVLVVDDSLVDRKIVERLLLKSGSAFEVVAVDGGKKALEVLGLTEADDASSAAKGCNVDIILTDYCMPEMNGYELLKAVKEHKVRRSIPMVIMSSENDPQRISRCLAGGAEEFMLKPLQAADIQRLWNYARSPAPSTAKTGTKRKLSVDVVTENNESERRTRPRLAGVAVA